MWSPISNMLCLKPRECWDLLIFLFQMQVLLLEMDLAGWQHLHLMNRGSSVGALM